MDLRTAIKYNVESIDGTGSYNTKIYECFTYPVWDPDKVRNKPSVSIQNIIDTGLIDGIGQYPNGVLAKAADVFLNCILDWRGESNLTIAQDKVQADIERRFGNFPWMPVDATDSIGVATDIVFIDAVPHGVAETNPHCGMLIQYRVYYRQSITDPNTKL
jgi:hypothetical protein